MHKRFEVTGTRLDNKEQIYGFYAEYGDLNNKQHSLILVDCDEHGNFAKFEVDPTTVKLSTTELRESTNPFDLNEMLKLKDLIENKIESGGNKIREIMRLLLLHEKIEEELQEYEI